MATTATGRSLHHAMITYGKFLEILEPLIPDVDDPATEDRPGIPSINWVLENPDVRRLDITWKESPSANGHGRSVFGILGRRDANGGFRIIFMLEGGATAPEHIHTEGEFIHIAYGLMEDRNTKSADVLLRRGQSIVHGWESRHQPGQVTAPSTTDGQGTPSAVVIGFYDQPAGSTLVDPANATKPWTPHELIDEE